MKKYFLIGLFATVVSAVSAQSSNDLLLHVGIDVLKTDNQNLFEKAQVGVELNYFVLRHFAVGGGAEIWTDRRSSFAMGVRWYANDQIFLRFRGLIGANEAAAGAGWAKPIGQNWRVEALSDLYLGNVDFALRAGVSYVIR